MFLSVLLCMGLAAGCLLASKILLHYFSWKAISFPDISEQSDGIYLRLSFPVFV